MAADPRSAQARELLQQVENANANRSAELGLRRKALKREQEEITREIRNEQKKRVRLMERARGLNDADLLAVICARAAAKTKAKAKAQDKSGSSMSLFVHVFAVARFQEHK